MLSLRARGLTYTTLLSLVPLLAVTFSVLKAFGIQNQLEPVLAQTLEPLGPKGAEITSRIIEFVNNLRVGVLGVVGVAVLFYTVISLIDRIEDSFNHIWRVRRSRSLARKFSDYFSVVLVGPVLVFTAFALTASAQSYWLVQRILEITPSGFSMIRVTHLMPFVFFCAAFTFLYRFIPYTRVRLTSALVGGVVAGILWQLAGVGFAVFVTSSARYAAIYSSFAILILFLYWLYVGWLIVLVGGEVAYFHQHPSAYRQGVSREEQCHLFRERLALLALVRVTRCYLLGKPPWCPADLAAALGMPLSSLEDLIDEFVQRGTLLRTAEPQGITLGRPPEQVTVIEVLDALRGPESAESTGEQGNSVSGILHNRDQAVRQALEGVTLRSLASETSIPFAELKAPVAKVLVK